MKGGDEWMNQTSKRVIRQRAKGGFRHEY